MADNDASTLVTEVEARSVELRGHAPALRLIACGACGCRARRIDVSGELLNGNCLRCGRSLDAPLATESVTLVELRDP